MTKTPKRPRDPNQLGKLIVDLSVGEVTEKPEPASGSPVKAALRQEEPARKNLRQSGVTKLRLMLPRDNGRGRGEMVKGSKIAVGVSATEETIESIDQKLLEKRKRLAEVRGSSCFPMMLRMTNIGNALVDDIYEDLKTNFSSCKKIDVILDSGGGSVDAAFNISLLFRQFAPERLCFIIPRWAKSAATLLACSGDEILMTPPAELGPLESV